MEEEQSEEKPQCGNISCPLGWPLSKTKKKKKKTQKIIVFTTANRGNNPSVRRQMNEYVRYDIYMQQDVIWP